MSKSTYNTSEFEDIVSDNKFLSQYLDERGISISEIDYIPSKNLRYKPDVHQVYRIDNERFIHISTDKPIYNIISGCLPTNDELVQKTGTRLLKKRGVQNHSDLLDLSSEDIEQFVRNQLSVPVGSSRMSFFQSMSVDIGGKIYSSEEKRDRVISTLERDFNGYGHIDAMIEDDNIEYIHVTDASSIVVNLSGYGLVQTSLEISPDMYDEFLKSTIRKSSAEYSPDKSVYNGILNDGSRINAIISSDSSHSLTIRQARSDRLSIIDLINSNTLSTEIAAYLWMCLENDMNIFFAGETSSGKTTLANSCLSFIKDSEKVITIEDTSELYPPQSTWQRLISNEESDMQDLLVESLRMNPDLIAVGEVRGEETDTLFQAMESGHPIITTIHSSNISSIINRLQDDPINIPKRSISEIDVIIFLDKIIMSSGEVVRAVDSIVEIGSYYQEENLIESRTIFEIQEIGNYTTDIRSSMMVDSADNGNMFESSISLLSDIQKRQDFLKKRVEKENSSYYSLYDKIQNYRG